MSLKNDQGDSSHLNNADDIEKQQEQEPLRLIKVQSKKKGYRGELMLVESTFFYHDEGGLKSKSHSVSKLEEYATYKERERRRRQTVVVRERVDVSGSLMFNATEEAKFQKAMAYDMRMNEDSNYDIEDIPMHSSRDP